ncbi:MAG TPA: hypothetical protein VFJ13_12190 [Paracoccaceae bacterium]|nr:hypothetical protein [Paracoccaceae bacterium]
MQRAAEWALHDLRRQEHGLRVSQHEVLAALARDGALFIALAPALSRRLSGIASRADALEAAGDRQTELLLEQTGRLRQAERLERTVGSEIERTGERTGLEDLVDLIAGGARARLR